MKIKMAFVKARIRTQETRNKTEKLMISSHR